MTKSEFTQITSNWDSHRPLLWEALEATKHLKLPVLELGVGYGSTPLLQEYCKDEGLLLFSYDFDSNWAFKFHAIHTRNWDVPWEKEYSVVLVDESPGEHRKISISKLHHAKIVVAHDTEKAADHGYKMRAELTKYKYAIEYITDGAGAMAVSNFINVTEWKI